MKKARQLPHGERSSTGIVVLGLSGVVLTIVLIGTFAAIPFLRQARQNSAAPQSQVLAGVAYSTTVQVDDNGNYRVQMVASPSPAMPPSSASISMSGGGMEQPAPIISMTPGIYEIKGVLPMRGDFYLTIVSTDGQKVVIPLGG